MVKNHEKYWKNKFVKLNMKKKIVKYTKKKLRKKLVCKN